MKETKNNLSLPLAQREKTTIEKLLPFIQDLRAAGYRDISEEDFRVFLQVLEKIWENYHQYELPTKIKNPLKSERVNSNK